MAAAVAPWHAAQEIEPTAHLAPRRGREPVTSFLHLVHSPSPDARAFTSCPRAHGSSASGGSSRVRACRGCAAPPPRSSAGWGSPASLWRLTLCATVLASPDGLPPYPRSVRWRCSPPARHARPAEWASCSIHGPCNTWARARTRGTSGTGRSSSLRPRWRPASRSSARSSLGQPRSGPPRSPIGSSNSRCASIRNSIRRTVLSLLLAGGTAVGAAALAFLVIRRGEYLAHEPSMRPITAASIDIADLPRERCVSLGQSTRGAQLHFRRSRLVDGGGAVRRFARPSVVRRHRAGGARVALAPRDGPQVGLCRNRGRGTALRRDPQSAGRGARELRRSSSRGIPRSSLQPALRHGLARREARRRMRS